MSQMSSSPVIPVRTLLPWSAAVPVLLIVAYLVTMDSAGVLASAGDFLHELMHDGRHLLGVPCH